MSIAAVDMNRRRSPINADAVDVDERVPGGELFDRGFLIGQSVVAQVSVAEGVIPLRAVRVAAAIATSITIKPSFAQQTFWLLERRFSYALGLGPG